MSLKVCSLYIEVAKILIISKKYAKPSMLLYVSFSYLFNSKAEYNKVK